jgi:3-deoxy-manno-octulosonate cytidylyltransferase (CMP-KDO synthetase)
MYKKNHQIAVIIPARYNSKRLPGKPLIKINNESLVMKTYKKIQNVLHKKHIYITSDSQKVLDEFKNITNNLILVNKECLNGTERCSYALKNIKKNYKYFLISSCDMPFLNSEVLDFLFNKIVKSKKNYDAFTVHTEVKNKKAIKNTTIAKVVLNLNDEIMYISRSPIPTYITAYNKFFNPIGKKTHYSHHGIVAIKKDVLNKYKYLKNSKLQLLEDNEWLKLIENGYKIKSYYFKKISPEINTKSDLKQYIPIYFKKKKNLRK